MQKDGEYVDDGYFERKVLHMYRQQWARQLGACLR